MAGSYGPSANDFKTVTANRKVRPALKEILEAVDAHEVDCVAAYDLSRIYRRADYLLDFLAFVRRHQVGLAIVADPVELSTLSGEPKENDDEQE